MPTSFDDDNFFDLLPLDKYDSVPAELKQAKSWLVYRMEPRSEGGKNKIPYDPSTGRKANNPELGVSFEFAKAAEKDYSGLGFYVENPFLVIDIDSCVKPDGSVEPYAEEIVKEINSYTEASPSGTGLHIWVRGNKPGDACRRGIEIYSTKRFLTVTGLHFPSTPKEIRKVNVASVYNRMLAGDFQESKKPVTPVSESSLKAPSTEIHSSGSVTTSKMQLLMNGEILSSKPFVITDQYGNTLQYPSQSEADGALAILLAFKHEGDLEKMDGDFRVSALYRKKWDRPDYRDATLKSASVFYRKSKALDDTPKTSSSATVIEDDEDEIVEVDSKLPDFPEFTGSLADLSDAMSPDIPRAFKFAAAFTHMGLIRSGLDTLVAEPHIQPRFYTALIAGPGRGKTAAINEVNRVMRNLTNKYQIFSSIDSGPALVDAFQDQIRAGIMSATGTDNITDSVMAKILLSPDELKGVFEKAKITTGSRNSMLDELLKLYEGNTTGNRVRGMKIKIHIEGAYLGLLGGATETGYSSMWTGTGGASDGLQSRIIPVGVEDQKMPPMQRPPDAEKLAKVIQRLTEQATQPAAQFDIAEDALKMYEKWWMAKDQSKPSEVRVDGVVKRLLVILARTNDVSVITDDLMQQAIDFGDFVIACRDKYNPLDASTWSQMFENLIIAAYQKHGDMSPNKCRRVVHPERRPGGAGPFLQAYKNLTQAGMLRLVTKTQRSGVYKLSL
jgi:putative DNA primase/helicase